MAVIRLHNVTYRRGDRRILSDVCWTVKAGEHWAILGANGAGKTTLLKVITGYEWVTDGAVEVLGQVFGQCHIPQLRKAIGWVSSTLEHQVPGRDRAVDIVASGLDASLGLYREPGPEEYARSHEALAAVGSAEIAEQRYELLSQGERQRVLIARALVSRPALLILDEPCAGLDPAARAAFLGDLGRLAARPDSPSTVLVTHHIEEIGGWIGHVLVLRAGRVLAAGPKPEVLRGEILAEAFGRPCTVEHCDGEYRLRLCV